MYIYYIVTTLLTYVLIDRTRFPGDIDHQKPHALHTIHNSTLLSTHNWQTRATRLDVSQGHQT